MEFIGDGVQVPGNPCSNCTSSRFGCTYVGLEGKVRFMRVTEITTLNILHKRSPPGLKKWYVHNPNWRHSKDDGNSLQGLENKMEKLERLLRQVRLHPSESRVSLTSHAIYDQKKRSTINFWSRRSSDCPLSPVPSSPTLQARLTQMLPPWRLLRNHGYANRQIACPQVQGTKILLLFHGDRSPCPPMRTHTTMATPPRACCRRSVRYSEHAISVGERKVRPTFSSTPQGLTYVQSDVSE